MYIYIYIDGQWKSTENKEKDGRIRKHYKNNITNKSLLKIGRKVRN
jgi:hypothetical protein